MWLVTTRPEPNRGTKASQPFDCRYILSSLLSLLTYTGHVSPYVLDTDFLLAKKKTFFHLYNDFRFSQTKAMSIVTYACNAVGEYFGEANNHRGVTWFAPRCKSAKCLHAHVSFCTRSQLLYHHMKE